MVLTHATRVRVPVSEFFKNYFGNYITKYVITIVYVFGQLHLSVLELFKLFKPMVVFLRIALYILRFAEYLLHRL